MSSFVIEGRVPLRGRHISPGNKNAALPMIAATMLADSPVTLTNLPVIGDVKVMLELAESLGAKVDVDFAKRTATIDPTTLSTTELPADLCAKVRTSILFAGPLLAKYGSAIMPNPGGDPIGQRPLDTHFHGLKKLGAEHNSDRGLFRFSATGRLHGGVRIVQDEASVTATENLVMAAALADGGQTEIYNAACEPHVQNLCQMLVKMGANIEGIGTNRLLITGVSKLSGATCRIAPDYIETASFIAAAAATRGSIEIPDTERDEFEILERPFARLGVRWRRDPASGLLRFDSEENGALQIAPGIFGAIPKIDDGIWPLTPSDVMSVLIILATQAEGVVLFFEKMFESRMHFVDSLVSMGAQIVQCDPHRIVVKGPAQLRGARIQSPDIRAGMAMIIAGLCAEGTTTIGNAESIDRGYENLEHSLTELGAKIRRE